MTRQNVRLNIGGVVGKVADLQKISDRYAPTERIDAVQLVFRSIDEEEQVALLQMVAIHDGQQSVTKLFWVFLFLCLAAQSRPGSSPLDIARDINHARSAKGILI